MAFERARTVMLLLVATNACAIRLARTTPLMMMSDPRLMSTTPVDFVVGSELVAMEELEEPTPVVSSWYDNGIRLAPDEPAGVESWYDKLQEMEPKAKFSDQWETSPVVPKPPPPPLPPPPPPMTASTEASLAAALISGLAVVGVDLVGAGVVENLDIAVLAGGLALSQVDSAGPVGTTLRTVGNVTSIVANEVVVPVATGLSNFAEKNELGIKARAALEIGIEQAIYAVDELAGSGERRAREKAEEEARIAAEKAAAEAARLQAERDAKPWWDPTKYQ